jgi:Putative nucleotidyltransferase DUF294
MSVMEIRPVNNAIEVLENKLGANWGAIRKAQVKTEELLTNLKAVLTDLEDPNCAVVVTGSLGRGEANDSSDADWLLLVDGPSDPYHARMAREIDDRVRRAGFKDVGPTGTFGGVVVSHELVHYIAGTRDTNENLTRRILLLAESRPLTSPVVRERVIRNVLDRYVRYDRSVQSSTGEYNRVPHFLLNDVVRYWRTMASDYASKMWERTGKGWGIRNVKLRFSRKLLFVWGLLASFSGELFGQEVLARAQHEEELLILLSNLIREQTDVAPLELLARVAINDWVKKDTATDIFSAYNEFLDALSDRETRSHLETVRFEDAASDNIYSQLRTTSRRFRLGINDLFFDQHHQLKRLIRDFGVF